MKAYKNLIVLIAIIYTILLKTEISGYFLFNHLINQVLENNIKRSINTTADPCEDFYAYSCGNYNGYPDSGENVQEITQYMDQIFNTKLRQLFKPENVLSRLFSKAKNFFSFGKKTQKIREKTLNYYQACVREKRKNFVKYFEELQIKWALLPGDCDTCCGIRSEHFWQILGQLQAYNWNNLIIKHEITASKDGSLNIILQPGFNKEQQPSNLPADIAIEGILKALKVDKASVIVQQLKDTQQKWLEIFQNNTSSKDSDLEMSFEELALQYPFLRFYLQTLLKRMHNKINKIWLKNISYFQYLQEIKWPTEEWQQQLNYLMLHFLFYLFEDSTQEFTANACVVELRKKLDLAVNYMYYDEIFLKDYTCYQEELKPLNQRLQITFQNIFEENQFNLTTQQVEDLKKKLQNIQFNLGNLPNPVSNDAIETFYEDVPNLDSGNYFKNHLLLLKHRFLKSLVYQKDLNFYITPDNSLDSTSSMFYVPKQNLVVVPFASLQYPLYHYNFKPQYQLSLMGFLMAHEIGHAFDTYGLMATNHSSLLQHDLYKKSVECMQQQKPTEDIEERIADLFAERVAYQSYETFYNAVNNTNLQRQFYLSIGQFFCNKGDLEFIGHDPSDVRLKQIVKNSEGFAKAFNCSLDSPMNPQLKCRLF